MAVKEPESKSPVEVDMTEINKWIGVPYGGKQVKEPFVVGDFRRWAAHTDNYNPLHWNDEWAAESRFGRLVAPMSFQADRDLGGVYNAVMGGRFAYHSGDEFFFYGPRVYAGDKFKIDRMLVKARATTTRYGPSVFSDVDMTYSTERGTVMKKRTTTMNPVGSAAGNSRTVAATGKPQEEPEWSDEQLAQIEQDKLDYVRTWRTHAQRLLSTVKVGDKLPRCVLGPHSGVRFMDAEACDLESAWGMLHVPDGQMPLLPRAPMSAAEQEKETLMPRRRMTDWKNGHLYNKWSQTRGMPRAFAVGSVLSIWGVDHFANWAGEWGFLRHFAMRFGLPVLSGDLTYIDAEVTAIRPGPAGFGIVAFSYAFTDQDGGRTCTGTAEVELPVG